MASLRCHGDSDCNKTQVKRIFHLYIIQLWKSFFHIFTHGDVINAQTWEVSPPKDPVEPPEAFLLFRSILEELKKNYFYMWETWIKINGRQIAIKEFT